MTSRDGEMQELLPCPFCGGTPEVRRQGNNHTKSRKLVIRCPDCRIERTNAAIRHGFDWLEEVSFKAWNTRAQQAEAEPTVKDCLTVRQEEAVAWRWRDDVHPGLPWRTTTDSEVIDQLRSNGGYEIEPLFTRPQPQVDEDRRDAERYRWLRNCSAGQWEHPMVVSQQRRDDRMLYLGPMLGNGLDQAIDAAIGGSGEK